MQIRWMIRRDIIDVMEIENDSFNDPYTEEGLLDHLRQRNCIGMVAEDDRQNIVGFMIYKLMKTRLEVVDFAVDLESRRSGVGTALVNKLKTKLHQQRRQEIWFDTIDANLPCHLFLRACGFKAESVLRNHYETGDCYRFVYSVHQGACV